jgi:hypothetical protein
MFYIVVLNTVAANSNFKPKHQARVHSQNSRMKINAPINVNPEGGGVGQGVGI